MYDGVWQIARKSRVHIINIINISMTISIMIMIIVGITIFSLSLSLSLSLYIYIYIERERERDLLSQGAATAWRYSGRLVAVGAER